MLTASNTLFSNKTISFVKYIILKHFIFNFYNFKETNAMLKVCWKYPHGKNYDSSILILFNKYALSAATNVRNCNLN